MDELEIKWMFLPTEKRRELYNQHKESLRDPKTRTTFREFITERLKGDEKTTTRAPTPTPVKSREPVKEKAKETKTMIKEMDSQELVAHAKREWESSKSIRDEFRGNYDAYLAFMKADAAGKVRILNKK